MADQNTSAGILQDIGDLIRLEVPVHRHGVGAERHHCIGGFDEGDVVAHQDADAIARFDAELVQSARDARRSRSNIGVASAPISTADA